MDDLKSIIGKVATGATLSRDEAGNGELRPDLGGHEDVVPIPPATPPREALPALIQARLVLLQRAVRGTIDPRQLWCAANDGDATDKEDIVLPTWSLLRSARHARREWKSAKARLAWKSRRQAAG